MLRLSLLFACLFCLMPIAGAEQATSERWAFSYLYEAGRKEPLSAVTYTLWAAPLTSGRSRFALDLHAGTVAAVGPESTFAGAFAAVRASDRRSGFFGQAGLALSPEAGFEQPLRVVLGAGWRF